jgi:hypothetical protein
MRNGKVGNSRLLINRALSKFDHGNPLVTDRHMAAGSLTETVEKVGPKVVADPSLIATHVPSVKTQTLRNKAFPVIDRHGPSVAFCA